MWVFAAIIGLLFAYGETTDNADAGPNQHRCMTTFRLIRSHYLSCSPNHWTSGLRLIDRMNLTGSDLVEGLEAYCDTVTSTRQCFLDHYNGCPEDLVATLREIFARSTWICEEPGKARSSVVDVLTSDVDAIPEAEVSVSHCVNEVSVHECVTETLSHFNAIIGALRDPGASIGDFFSAPASRQYFPRLFDCVYDDVAGRCPQNALTMSLAGVYHLLFAPKLGINASAIILQKAAEEILV